MPRHAEAIPLFVRDSAVRWSRSALMCTTLPSALLKSFLQWLHAARHHGANLGLRSTEGGGMDLSGCRGRLEEYSALMVHFPHLKASDLMKGQSYHVKTILEQYVGTKKTFLAFKSIRSFALKYTYIQHCVLFNRFCACSVGNSKMAICSLVVSSLSFHASQYSSGSLSCHPGSFLISSC